jgi:hypothetical protein
MKICTYAHPYKINRSGRALKGSLDDVGTGGIALDGGLLIARTSGSRM